MERLSGLEQSHPDLFEILEHLNLGLAARYPDGTILWVNQRVCSWLGYEPEEIEGKHAEMLFPRAQAEREWIQGVTSGVVHRGAA